MLWFLWLQAFLFRCYRKAPVWPLWLWGLFEDLFIVGLVASLVRPFPVVFQKTILAFYFLYQCIDQALWNAVKIRLTPSLYSYFQDYRSFRSSLFAFKSACYLPALLLTLSLCTIYFYTFDNEWAMAPFCLLFGIGVWKQPIAYDHPALIFIKKKKRSIQQPSSQNVYPLLRQSGEYHTPRRLFIQKEKGDKPHVIFFIVESFRAKNIGVLGGEPSLSPRFDAAAKKGVLFTQFYANGTLSSRALIASFMGILAAQTPSHMSYYSKIGMRGLPQILKDEGYLSAFFSASFLSFQGMDLFLKNQGIDCLFDRRAIAQQIPHAQSTSWGLYDEYTAAASLDWLKKQTKPTFTTLFTTTNHHPWELPSHWEKKHPNAPYADTFLYTDAVLGDWIERAERENILERSLVFIFGDHGQSLGEHNANFPIRRTLFEEEIRVPMLFLAKGRVAPGQRCDRVCSQIDLLPTVLDALDIHSSHHSLGSSLLREEETAVYFNQPFDLPSIGCRKGDWKFLKRAEAEHLFNLKEDPEERVDVKEDFVSIHSGLKEDTESFFTRLESLYEHNAFYPCDLQAATTEWKAPIEIEDERLAQTLKAMPLLFSLDLSQCSHISRKSLKELPREIKKLNLSHAWRVDDSTVEAIAERLPKLCEIDLSYCPLITERSLDSLARHCHFLESISLKGLDTIAPPKKTFTSLVHLNLSDCSRSLPLHWADWIGSLNYLKILQFDCFDWNKNNLKALSRVFFSLQQLELSQGNLLTDVDVCSLFETPLPIGALTLNAFPHLTDEGLKTLKDSKIQRLMLANCPLLTASGVASLISSLPLQTLIIKRCASMKAEELKEMESKFLKIILL